jgi:hypothetical protein
MTDLLNQPYAISLVSAANLEELSLDGGRFFGGQLRFWAGKMRIGEMHRTEVTEGD